jgi:hypothetical protein
LQRDLKKNKDVAKKSIVHATSTMEAPKFGGSVRVYL